MKTKRSRVHPKYKTKYRVRNWAEYDRGLVGRGDLTIWLSDRALAAWTPAKGGGRGRPPKYSDLAIEAALMLRMVYRLPFRHTEGLLNSVLRLMGLDLTAPDHTTLSRRAARLDICLKVPSAGPLHLIVDSTGLAVRGEGQWATWKYGGRGSRRGWRKLHLGVDGEGQIVACALTPGYAGDSLTVVEMLNKLPNDIERFTADGGYDAQCVY